jgi:plasmid stabilization system protein ParE
VQVRWKRRALSDLLAFREWLASLPDAQADRTVVRIRVAAQSLARRGDIGRLGKFQDTRELSVRDAPYVIVYQVRKDHFSIVAVYHTAQDR